MTEHGNKRFGTRLPVRIRVEAQLGRALHSLYTYDVGLEGLFLTSAEPPSRHHLVHVALHLPDECTKVRLRGVIVRTIDPVEAATCGLPAGMGVHVYGLSDATRRKWYRFIERSQLEFAKTCESDTPVPVRAEAATGAADAAGAAVATDVAEQPHVAFGPLRPPPAHLWTPLPGGDMSPLRGKAPTPRTLLTPTPADLALNVHRLVQTARGHAWHPPWLHRISPEKSGELRRFLDEALMKEGIVLLGRPPDTDNALAVVAVVHPDTGAEFHVPGRVVHRKAFASSTAIRFLGVSQRTVDDFEHFAMVGSPPPLATDVTTTSAELVIYEDANETQGHMGDDPPRCSEVRAYRSINPTVLEM